MRRAGLRPACIVLSVGGLRFQKKRYTPVQVLPLFLRRFGPRFTAYSVLAGLSGSLPFALPRSGLMGFRELARAYDIPLVLSDDSSGDATVAQLRQRGVELFVTSMCDQILREPLLSLPRHGCLNIHASLLPDFRGVDSVFQSMLHDAPRAGRWTSPRLATRTARGPSAMSCAASMRRASPSGVPRTSCASSALTTCWRASRKRSDSQSRQGRSWTRRV